MQPLAFCLPVLVVVLSLAGSAGAEAAALPAERAIASGDVRLYVSTAGQDAWSGTAAEPNSGKSDGPFASLERARNEIRKRKAAGARGPFTVLVRGGVYCLRQTFTLGAEDSGDETGDVVFSRYAREKAILVGGRKLAGFTPYQGKILKADVASQGLKGVYFRQLFFAGQRQQLARYPNYDPRNPYAGGWAYVDGKPVELWDKVPGEDRRTLKLKPEDLRRWSNVDEAEILIFPRYNWWNDLIRVESLDRARRTVKLAGNASYEIRPGDRFFIRNLREELDAPGEWYLDRKTSTLYFWPPAPLETGDVYVPTLEQIVHMQGTRHVVLRGFTIECCEGTAIQLCDCRHCGVVGCTVRNVGGRCQWDDAAVDVAGGAGNTVRGCDIYEVGGHAVRLSGGDRKTLLPAEHRADNNYIHHTGVFYKQGVGVELAGVGSVASHNLIHDCPRFAILVSGNDHRIEFNHGRHLDLETADTGAVYAGGRDWLTPRGTVIAYNFFHDMYGFGLEKGRWVSPHYAWGIYLDDNAAEVTVYGNIVARAIRGPIHFHCARDNTIENNIFLDGTLQQVEMNGWTNYAAFLDQMAPAYEEFIKLPAWKKYPGFQRGGHPNSAVPMAGNRFQRNIFSFHGAQAALYHFNNLRLPTFVCDRNLVWHAGRPLRVVAGQIAQDVPPEKQWEKWQSLGFDRHSLVADPRFVDPDKDDYRLKADSPAFQLGFKPIPVEKIGPYPDADRASWPIVEAAGARELAPQIAPGKE